MSRFDFFVCYLFFLEGGISNQFNFYFLLTQSHYHGMRQKNIEIKLFQPKQKIMYYNM